MDADQVQSAICEIAAVDVGDGVRFDVSSAKTEVIREDEGYQGLRVRMRASIATAQLAFSVDVSVGDPIEPALRDVNVPSL